jgi:lysozyme
MILEAAKTTVELCKPFEGLHTRRPDGLIYPYLCPAGFWTQGYGLLCRKDDPPITPAEAERRLLAAVPVYIAGALAAAPNLRNHPPEVLGALGDFCFNLGIAAFRSSTLARRVRAEAWDTVPAELARWVRGGGRVLPGLVRRRQAEAEIIQRALTR